ncbi:sperm microtubule associated protein 2-like isoform X2 [Ptychodera flava]|uniref:sperm microtubule associated protein 2-like isoform X2 n=1 Tax=Ptychodera flava TaxID=63121 RepID=UPI003969E1E3
MPPHNGSRWRSAPSTSNTLERRPASRRGLRGMERIYELAQPKDSKCIWLTSFGPNMSWGNQEPMWPIAQATLNANSTTRLVSLSEPKKNFQERLNRPEFVNSCGRGSVILEVSPGATKASASERVSTLAGHKQPPQAFKEDRPEHTFSCGRESPIWLVNEAAKRAPDRERIESLAQTKALHRNFLPAREIETKVTKAAMSTSATPRLEMLSRPKSRPEGPFRDSMWPVSKSARHATATPRQMELAKTKSVSDGYLPARTIQWPVSKAARKAMATPRTDELSRPIIRATMDHVQFNPDAFIVSEAAKKARCPPRIEELAQPIQR